jgi:uncharacterized protein (TIGR04255 family)
MIENPIIEIKTDEPFELLSKAPIVEAVIEIRAKAGSAYQEEEARKVFEDELTGYGYLDSLRTFQFHTGQPKEQMINNFEWQGIRFQSGDKRQIAQFKRDGLVFSRLAPYNGWPAFSTEALKLWDIYKEHVKPENPQRLGVRFINRIQLASADDKIDDYIRQGPQSPSNLNFPLASFLHKDFLIVPGQPYAINIITTVQHAQGRNDNFGALILDIDVITTESFHDDKPRLQQRLEDMRRLKNKVFFSMITAKAKEKFR